MFQDSKTSASQENHHHDGESRFFFATVTGFNSSSLVQMQFLKIPGNSSVPGEKKSLGVTRSGADLLRCVEYLNSTTKYDSSTH